MITVNEAYDIKDSFQFNCDENLNKQCNAPKTQGGVYLVYEHASNQLIYIGSSGWVNQDGSFGLRKNGMWERIVNGDHEFVIQGTKQKDKRKIIWPLKMNDDRIEQLRVDWFVTFNESIRHIPAFVEATLLQQYFDKYNVLPRWNKCF